MKRDMSGLRIVVITFTDGWQKKNLVVHYSPAKWFIAKSRTVPEG